MKIVIDPTELPNRDYVVIMIKTKGKIDRSKKSIESAVSNGFLLQVYFCW